MSRRDTAHERRVVLVERRGRFHVGAPVFERGPQVPLARGKVRVEAGRMALAELGREAALPLRALGSPKRASDVVEALLWDRGMVRGFAARVAEEARDTARQALADTGSRLDLTALETFTVDPASARDFDDAVSAERTDDGFRLWVHIADVAAHVRPGTGLEAEARRRAVSTYAPGTVEPMLPGSLSEEACSLAPGAPRLAVSAELEISQSGEPRRESFERTLIRSDARLDYDQLDRIFSGRERPPSPIGASLEVARQAAAALAGRRPRTSIEVATTEPEFEFDSGDVVGARRIEQSEAHRMIERLMIFCNERVAALLERRGTPTLYRVHEQPDPERVRFLVEQLAALDVPTPPLPERISRTQAGELAGEASRLVAREARRRGHGGEAYSGLVLRALARAHYSESNLGHAGLGSPAYVHFTSPIRRYPDLVAHRSLLSILGEEAPPDPTAVREDGWHCSARERQAAVVERDADDLCAAFLLERELFEAGWQHEFEGEVSGVIGAGAFVSFAGEIADVYEGFLPARTLAGERFDLDQTETALVGGRSGRRLRLGDPVTVRVTSIEAPRGRVDLAPGEAVPYT